MAEWVGMYYLAHGLSALRAGLQMKNLGLIAHGYSIVTSLMSPALTTTPDKSPSLVDLDTLVDEGGASCDQTAHSLDRHFEDGRTECDLLLSAAEKVLHTDPSRDSQISCQTVETPSGLGDSGQCIQTSTGS